MLPRQIHFKQLTITPALWAILCVFTTHATAQVKWQLKKDEDGIRVYTGSAQRCDFKSIKVECTVNATLSQMVVFLLDVDKQKEWVYSNKSTRIIKKIAPNEIIYHAEIEAPWPCTNRDYVSHITISQHIPHSLTIEAKTVSGIVPETPGIVRVKSSQALWEITSINKGLQKIVYTVQFDPSGALPAWLVNMFVTKGPLITFQNLKECINRPEYKNAHVDFIKD